jgi:hypothetical protein
MFKVISLIIVSGLIGYLGGIAQMHHYGLQKYAEIIREYLSKE